MLGQNLYRARVLGYGGINMSGLMTFEELAARVIVTARDQTPRPAIELGVIHGFCLDVAEDLAPELIGVLASVDGLHLLVAALETMPDIVKPSSGDKSSWEFVR